MADDLGFLDDDVITSEEEVFGHGDVFLDGEGRAVDATLSEAGEVEDGFTEGLGGDGAGVYAYPAHHLPAFADSNLLPQLGGLYSGALTGRTGADDKHVVAPAVGQIAQENPLSKAPGTLLQCSWGRVGVSMEVGILFGCC